MRTGSIPGRAWRIRLLLLAAAWLAGAWLPAAAQVCPSSDGAGYTYVDNGGSSAYNVGAGQSLLINAGTFTGNVDGPAAGGLVCVNPGAAFRPGNVNNMSGTVRNHGIVAFTGTSFGGGSTFDNQAGEMSFSNTNANGPMTITNAAGAVIRAGGGTVVIPNNSTVVNAGTVDVTAGANLDIQGQGSEVLNTGTIDLNGDNITLSGQVVNEGFIREAGEIHINGGDLRNGCSMLASSQIINNAALRNEGYMLVTSGTGVLLNNGALTQAVDAVIVGAEFHNDNSVTGGGRYHFTGVTSNQGTFAGSDPADPIVFYDASQSVPPAIFDQQTQAPTNTLRVSFDPPSVEEALAQCDPTFPNPPAADVSVTKQSDVDAVASGSEVHYGIVVSNAGPDGAEGTVLTDQPEDGHTCTAVACTASTGGATCPEVGTAPGQLSLANLLGAGVVLDLPAGGSLEFELTCTVETP